MESVFGIADGTDGHYHLQVPTYATENAYCLGEGIPTLVDGEFFFLKEALRTLLAVVHNLAGLSQTIDVVGAGALIMAVNLNTFVHAVGLLPGGFTGITLLIQEVFAKYLNIKIPFVLFYWGLNVV